VLPATCKAVAVYATALFWLMSRTAAEFEPVTAAFAEAEE